MPQLELFYLSMFLLALLITAVQRAPKCKPPDDIDYTCLKCEFPQPSLDLSFCQITSRLVCTWAHGVHNGSKECLERRTYFVPSSTQHSREGIGAYTPRRDRRDSIAQHQAVRVRDCHTSASQTTVIHAGNSVGAKPSEGYIVKSWCIRLFFDTPRVQHPTPE